MVRQIGTLTIVCAKRKNVLLQILDGKVTVHVGEGPDKAHLSAEWNDDEKISGMIYELNHGKYSKNAS